MLYIDSTRSEVKNSELEHWKFLSCRIQKKLFGKDCCQKDCSICSKTRIHRRGLHSGLFKDLVNFILNDNRLIRIITGKPEELLDIDQKSKQIFDYENDNLVNDIKSIFNYDWFVGLPANHFYSAYHLAENLNRRSCTYCNRTYTTTMRSEKGGKLMRPHFDHWFPRSEYPLLALSFYNLIPSCYICNSSSKGSTVLNLNEHIHPYVDVEQTAGFSFSYIYSDETKSLDEYRIILECVNKENKKSIETLKALGIDVMYNAHYDELKDLIKIRQSYSETYIQNLRELFPNKSLGEPEIFRLLFGTELDAKDFHKRPLSKFKSDILKELKMI
jgi:hypothetical protein